VMSPARPASQKFEHTAIVCVVGAFALVGVVCLVLAMRHPIEPFLGADRGSQPSDVWATFTSGPEPVDTDQSTPVTPPPTETFQTPPIALLNQPSTNLSEAQLAAFLREVGIWYDGRAETMRTPQNKPSPPRALQRHWSQHSARTQADREEAARRMADELRQPGGAPVSSLLSTRSDQRPRQAIQRGESLD
jgi:hypothetical protein